MSGVSKRPEGIWLSARERRALADIAATQPEKFQNTVKQRGNVVLFQELDPASLCDACRQVYFEKSGWLRVNANTKPEVWICKECAAPIHARREAAEEAKQKQALKKQVESIAQRFYESALRIGYSGDPKQWGNDRVPIGIILPNGQVVHTNASLSTGGTAGYEVRRAGTDHVRHVESPPTFMTVHIPQLNVAVPYRNASATYWEETP